MPALTFSRALTDIHALLADDPQVTTALITPIAKLHYFSFHNDTEWSGARADFTLNVTEIVSSSSADTVTATLASSTITSAGTPFTSGMAGRQIQILSEPQYYFIKTFTSTSEITLGDGNGNTVTWPRATASGIAWRVFQTIYTLPSDCSSVIDLMGESVIDEIDGGRAALDRVDPERDHENDHLEGWAYSGRNSSGVKQIEAWPSAITARTYRGRYIREGADLSDSSVLEVDYTPFIYGAARDVALRMFAKLGDPKWMEIRDRLSSTYEETSDRAMFRDMTRRSPVRQINRHRGRTGRPRNYHITHFTDF